MAFGKRTDAPGGKPGIAIIIGKADRAPGAPARRPPPLESDNPPAPKDPMPKAPPSKPSTPSASSAAPGGPAEGGDPKAQGKAESPEAAGFTDQNQTCSNCGYFDQDSGGGIGECTYPVAVDFTVSDPMSSQCKHWESGGSAAHEKGESPATESAEQGGGAPAAPSAAGPKAGMAPQ